MKKLLFILILLVATAALFTGCADQNKLSAEQPTTITIWHVYGNQTKSPLNDAISEFNATEGKKQGVIVKITSLTNSTAIDKALIASANKEPGFAPMPNLFTAYPRLLNMIDNKLFLDWSQYFTSEELAAYNSDFLREGYEGKALFVLPIAKSTDVLFVNQTLFDRFAAATGATLEQMRDFDKIFELCRRYHAWSGGRDMFQINEYYHYFHINMASFGKDFIQNDTANTRDPIFARIFLPMAKAAIAGGLCVEKGYASDRWVTAAIISNVGSSAGVLYNRDYVIYDNNKKESVTNICLPYPGFLAAGGKPMFPHRGVGLFARKSDNEKENLAAAVFAKWIGQKAHNLQFATNIGYLPVNQQALKELLANPQSITSPKHRQLYESQKLAADEYAYLYLPRSKNVSKIQFKVENVTRLILADAQKKYHERVQAGEAPETVCDELAAKSLRQLQEYQL